MHKERTGSPEVIYKILDRSSWREACCTGTYLGSPIDQRDGFIHFSAPNQLVETARKHFFGQTDLLLVAVSPAQLGGALRWEKSRGGDLFPHLYGPLSTSAALWTRELEQGPDQMPIFPVEIPR